MNSIMKNDTAQAWSKGSTLYIHVPKPADVFVFNSSGNLEKQLDEAWGDYTLQLEAGAYIICIGINIFKVVIG